MLIRPDVLPEDLLGDTRVVREAWLLGARGKPVLAAEGRKAYSCMRFVHRASSNYINKNMEWYFID